MAPFEEKAGTKSPDSVEKSQSSTSSRHSMVLRSACKVRGCTAGVHCSAHHALHSPSLKSDEEKLTSSHRHSVHVTSSAKHVFVLKASSHQESHGYVLKSISSATNDSVETSESNKWKSGDFSDARSSSLALLSEKFSQQTVNTQTCGEEFFAGADSRTKSTLRENGHLSSSVTATLMARTRSPRNDMQALQQNTQAVGSPEVASSSAHGLHHQGGTPGNHLNANANHENMNNPPPPVAVANDFLSSIRNRESSYLRHRSSVKRGGSFLESNLNSSLYFTNSESDSRLGLHCYGYSDDENEPPELPAHPAPGWLRKIGKYIYFGLSKPLHYDFESLAWIDAFGKRKAVLIMLLPLLLWLLIGVFRKGETAEHFGKPLVYILGRLVSLIYPSLQIVHRKDVKIVTDQQRTDCKTMPVWPYWQNFFSSSVPSESEMDKPAKAATKAGSSHGGGGAFLSSHSPPPAAAEVSRSEIRSVVREIIREEIVKMQRGSDVTNQEVTRIQNELDGLRDEFKSLADAIRSVQRASTGQEKTKSSLHGDLEFHYLKNKLTSLEARLIMLDSVLSSAKNCCRNQTEAAAVEKHLTSVLLSIMDEDEHEVNPSLQPFRNWLVAKFSERHKLSDEVKNFAAELRGVKEDMKTFVKDIVRQYVDSMRREFIRDTSKLAYSLGESGALSAREVQKMIRDAIALYDADKTGETDYALESGGGSVVSTRCSETYTERSPKVTLFGFPLWSAPSSPRSAIQPDIHPGQCWAFRGSQGYLVIQLAATIRPTAFVIEHIPQSLSPTGNINSAPKDFSVWGLTSEKDTEGKLLGEYTFDKDGEPLQYFPVQADNDGFYSFVELKILSNHGELDYTCLYRFRVHGSRY